jgi:hypothetical protein
MRIVVRSTTSVLEHRPGKWPRNAVIVAILQARRECPCWSAQLWISIPSVSAILDTVAHSARSSVPDIDVDLTRRGALAELGVDEVTDIDSVPLPTYLDRIVEDIRSRIGSAASAS